jgi:hypothetical protein
MQTDNQCTYSVSTDVIHEARPARRVDILLVIDNSCSMLSKQRELSRALPRLIAWLDAESISYHIGVLTMDVGTLPPGAGSVLGDTQDACATEKGDDGLLQVLPCDSAQV